VFKRTSVGRILVRLDTEKRLYYWRRKVHDLRLIVAGDYSRVDSTAPSQKDPASTKTTGASDLASLYDALINNFEEGSSNEILQAIKTLVMQTSYRAPAIEFEDVAPIEADIMALYMKARLGPRPRGCEAVHHMRMALLDYIIGGVGWVWAGIRDGKPSVVAVDSMDVIWDTNAKLVPDIRWVAVRWRECLAYWVDLYGRKPFADLLQDEDAAMESEKELIYYFDLDGPMGTHVVLRGDNLTGGADQKPVYEGDNPHVLKCDGVPAPFLPVLPMYFMQLPSVTQPIGIAEMMLPAQLSTREAERTMREITKRGKGWIDSVKGAYDEENLAALEDGELMAIVQRDAGQPPAQYIPGAEIPAGLYQWYQHNKERLTAGSGASPYANSDKVEGIQYAAEVNAIQGAAGLTAGTLASDHAAHWERVVRATVANAIEFDDMPLTLTYNGEAIQFGPDNPIGPYLHPDANPKIAEDTLAYEPREKRMQRAMIVLQQALAVSAILPAAPALAFEEFLRAAGTKNIPEFMKPPAPAPMMPQQVDGAPGDEPENGPQPMNDEPEIAPSPAAHTQG
jgi:hypothetical protein